MRQAIYFTLVLMLAFACDNNYNPPQPYGVGSYYGSNSLAFNGTQSPNLFVEEDVVVEDTATSKADTAGEDVTATDIPTDLSEYVLGCIEENGAGSKAFAPYCLCLEELGGEDADFMCMCTYRVCVDNPPGPDDFLLASQCADLGYTGGNCVK
jgi:hypothetical protein